MKKGKREKRQFSKSLLIQESILIWVITISFLVLAFFCVINQYFGELPWITAMASLPWCAYSVSQACYYKKSEKENISGGITYDLAMLEAQQQGQFTDENQ